jgi:phosphatidylinositol alpha-1,6-mannosyltransferase
VSSSPRKPRVLVVTPDFPPALGGIQRLIHRLTEQLERMDVRIVTLGADTAEEFDRRSTVDVVRASRVAGIGHAGTIALLNVRAFVEALRVRPDVVLSAHINVSPAALAIKHALGVPYVQYLYGREVIIRRRLTRTGLHGAAAVVAISSYTRQLGLEHGAAPERIHCIPPGIDLVEQQRLTERSLPTIVTVARLEQRYKGHDVLLRALPLVRSRVAEARLVVIGNGPMQPVYESLASSLGLDGAVEFVGALDDAERDRLLDCGHVFAMTSRLPLDGGGEGFGIVYLEAAAHGLPAVAGNVGGAVDAVVHGETGLLVDPTDHVAVADALTSLLRSPETAQQLGRAGAERAAAFAWPKIARRVEDVLLEVAR